MRYNIDKENDKYMTEKQYRNKFERFFYECSHPKNLNSTEDGVRVPVQLSEQELMGYEVRSILTKSDLEYLKEMLKEREDYKWKKR